MGTLIFDHLYLLEILTTSQSCLCVFLFSVSLFNPLHRLCAATSIFFSRNLLVLKNF
jgi:hypothetical protein